MQRQELEKDFERQVRDHELLIYKVCCIYAYTDADRQDLFQEILIQLWKAYPKFKGASKLSTWMYRVAINTAISDVRRKKDFIKTYEPARLPDQQTHDDAAGHIAKEHTQQLYQAIAYLSEIEKAVIMLYLEERSYEEMEDILGISQGTLRVKMNRIKEKLRQLTKPVDYGT